MSAGRDREARKTAGGGKTGAEANDPRRILNSMDPRYGGLVATIEAPKHDFEEEDYYDVEGEEEDERDVRPSARGQPEGESMRYRAYYPSPGVPGFPDSAYEGPPTRRRQRDDAYYSSGSEEEAAPDGGRKRRRRTYETFDRDDVGGLGEGGRRRRRGGAEDDAEDDYDWMRREDPLGGGRSFLLRELKLKFLQLSTPLTGFVARYLSEKGEVTSQQGILQNFISVSRVFDSARETSDWDGLIKTLYGRGGRERDPELDMASLADTVIKMIRKDREYKERLAKGDETASIAKAILERELNAYARTADMLRTNYRNTIEGKVVFLLDQVFREKAQAVLDTINETYRIPTGKTQFTLLDVMRSAAVKTNFIKLMIMNEQASSMMGTSPMRAPTYGSGLYGTLADRASSGSAAYQRGLYGGGSRDNSYTIIQSRPSVGNMVAASLQYHELLTYFERVELTPPGTFPRLAYVYPSWGNSGGAFSGAPLGRTDGIEAYGELERFALSRTSRSSRSDCNRERERYERRYAYRLTASDPGSYLVPGDPPDALASVRSGVRSDESPGLPLGTLEGALAELSKLSRVKSEERRLQLSHDVRNGTYERVDPYVLAYAGPNGTTRYAYRTILYDPEALAKLSVTGDAGSYAIDASRVRSERARGPRA
jgi:hypothetical protein